jgi:hypothetical protein
MKQGCPTDGSEATTRCTQRNDESTQKYARSYERALQQVVETVRQRAGVKQQREAAERSLEVARIIRNEKLAEDATRRSLQEIVERTAHDRTAAAEASRKAEAEEPKIAEAVKQAEEARKAREAAEQRLADIKSRINAEQTVAKNAADHARVAEVAREQALRQEGEREADARLPIACSVTFEQFNKVRYGMQLREVNQLFGCQGKQTSGARVSGYGTLSTYSWDGNTEMSVVTATFKGNSLQSKAQLGLE